jgi:8-oxo-dGTP pyrophosphatase MutT (NUDIX family)
VSQLPEYALERARELAAGQADWTPVEPRSASTVLLLREAPGGLETYMMCRASTMAFAASAYVFPGGRLDPADLDAGALLDSTAHDYPALARRMSTDEATARGLLVCAVRELEEEAGVTIDPASLVLLDHWVTPEWERLRYDVRFFVAHMPDNQVAEPHGTEAVEARWIAPRAALAEADAGRMLLMAPTRAALEHLLEHDEITAVVAAADARAIVPRMDRLQIGDDGVESWAIVHDRTGEILSADRPAPPPESSPAR